LCFKFHRKRAISAKMIPRPSSIHQNNSVPNFYAQDEPSKCSRCLHAVQDFIVGGMERLFHNYGKSVASHPFLYILLCLIITAVCGSGLKFFRQENNGIKLWIPETSSQRCCCLRSRYNIYIRLILPIRPLTDKRINLSVHYELLLG